MKQRVFIVSSTEGLDIAYALQVALQNDAEVTVWSQEAFAPSRTMIESLEDALGAADFAVAVFSPDDDIEIRRVQEKAVRDNVLFELGLFIGRIGRQRTFFLVPKDHSIRIVSDLLGVNALQFDNARSDGLLTAAVGPAAHQIRKEIRKRMAEVSSPAHTIPSKPVELNTPYLLRRTLLTPVQQMLLATIERSDPASLDLLKSKSRDSSTIELHYRLEQLRLLMFINVRTDPTDDESRIYELTEEFRFALRHPSLGMANQFNSMDSPIYKFPTSGPVSSDTPWTPSTPPTPQTPPSLPPQPLPESASRGVSKPKRGK